MHYSKVHKLGVQYRSKMNCSQCPHIMHAQLLSHKVG